MFKRGMIGVYQHCGERHFHRYVAEFELWYNHRVRFGVIDEERTDRILRGIVEKRWTRQARLPDMAGLKGAR